MWLLKLVPMYVIIGLILILGLWVLYRLIFKKEVKLSKLLSKKIKKFVKKFKEVDKREQYANFLRSKKYLDFYEKYGLLSKRSKKEIESNLLTCGYENAEGYIINFFKEMHWIVLAIIIIGATNIILTGLIWIMVNEVLMITTILTVVLVIVASLFILAPLVLKAQVKDLKKKLTLQNFNGLMKKGLIPETLLTEQKIFIFNKFLKTYCKKNEYFILNNKNYEFCSTFLEEDEFNIFNINNGIIYILQSQWEKIYKKVQKT